MTAPSSAPQTVRLVLALSLVTVVATGIAHGDQAMPTPASHTRTSGQTPAEARPQDPVDLLWRTEASGDGSDTRLFSLVGLSLGVDQDGDATFAGRGRFFVPFGGRSAFQVDGTYDWYQGRREGQLDFGLVSRVRRVQAAVFTSVRYVKLDRFDASGSLSQFGASFDYVFGRGRVGVFGTAGLKDADGLGRVRLRGHVFEERELRLVDQFGASGAVHVRDRAQVEGQLSFLNPAGRGRTTGGTVRVIYPVAAAWAITAEGAWNPSLIAETMQGRFTVGAQMGRWPAARASSSTDRPAPIEMPAIRYQAVTRTVRDGNDPPVADAGPDQTVVPTCSTPDPCVVDVRLDGGGVDPDGDPLTYRWTMRSGFTSGERFTMPPTDAWTAFEGREGHTYVLRLQVTDDRGATAIDEVTVTILTRGQ